MDGEEGPKVSMPRSLPAEGLVGWSRGDDASSEAATWPPAQPVGCQSRIKGGQ